MEDVQEGGGVLLDGEELDLSHDRQDWDALSDGERAFAERAGVLRKRRHRQREPGDQFRGGGGGAGGAVLLRVPDGDREHPLGGVLAADRHVRHGRRGQDARAARGAAGAVGARQGALGAALDASRRGVVRGALRGVCVRRGHFLFGVVLRHLLHEEARQAAGPVHVERAHQPRRGYAPTLRACSSPSCTARPPAARVLEIVESAVAVECAFVRDSLRVDLLGMNATAMCTYVEFCADRLLVALGQPKRYNVTCPFEWMTLISMQGKTNFFEKRVSEYAKAGVGVNAAEQAFDTDVDF